MQKINLLIVIIFLLGTAAIKAQEPLHHDEKMYIRPSDGRLFVNHHLPMYLRLSTSPDANAPSTLLKSETSPQYSNPFYLDTEGYNTIRTPYQVDTVTKKVIEPRQNIIFEVYADGSAPITKSDFTSAPKHISNGKRYCGKNLVVALTATDEISGVENILYSVNGAPYTPYKSPITIDKEQQYTLKYYAVDNVGNPELVTEKNGTEEFMLDITGPKSMHEVQGDQTNTILSGRTVIALSATDALSGVNKIYYKIDDKAVQTYLAPIKMQPLTEGEHTLTYYAVDNVKNEESANTFTFFVDKTPPIVVSETMGDKFLANGKEYSSGRTKIKLTAVDNKAGVKEIYYSIAGTANQLYDKPFYLPGKTGATNIKFFAIDNVNNKNTGDQSGSAFAVTYIDLTGPDLMHEFVGSTFMIRDTMFVNTSTKIKLKATDVEAGMQKITYSIDKGTEVVYSEPFVIDKAGFTQIDYIGHDNVNNTNSRSFYFIVDAAGPEIFSRYSILPIDKKQVNAETIEIFPSHVMLFLSATDAVVGANRILYSLNGAAEKLYGTYISGFKKDTEYLVKVKAFDELGNPSIKEFKFSIGK